MLAIVASGAKAFTLANVLPAIPGFWMDFMGFTTGTGASGDNRLASQ
jgi:hypothetical protein